jgi:hypothetical protein
MYSSKENQDKGRGMQAHIHDNSLKKQQLICNNASKYVLEWLHEHNKECTELLFDAQFFSDERDFYKYTIRALDRDSENVYLFELMYDHSNIEVGYLYTGAKSLSFMPADIIVS